MSRTTKIILASIAGLLLVCVVGVVGVLVLGRWAIGQAFTADPTQAASLGHQIATYDLPPGYSEMTAMNIAGTQMVFIGNKSNGGPIILLAQFASSVSDPEAMRRQMEQSMDQQANQQGLNLTTVGQEDVTIKGETVTMTIREGTSSAGNQIRQEEGVFAGNKGAAMVMISGSVNDWDKDTIDKFLNSIR